MNSAKDRPLITTITEKNDLQGPKIRTTKSKSNIMQNLIEAETMILLNKNDLEEDRFFETHLNKIVRGNKSPLIERE